MLAVKGKQMDDNLLPRLGMFPLGIKDVETYNRDYETAKKFYNIQQEKIFAGKKRKAQEYLDQNPPAALGQFFPRSRSPDLSRVSKDLLRLSEALAERFEVTQFDVLVAILGAIAAAIPGQYVVKVDATWSEPVQLYVILVNGSGTGKSGLIKILIGAMETKQKELMDTTNSQKNKLSQEIINEYNQQKVKNSKNEIIKELSGLSPVETTELLARRVEEVSKELLLPPQDESSLLHLSQFTGSSLESVLAKQGAISICSTEDPFNACQLAYPSSKFPTALLHGYDNESYSKRGRGGKSINRSSVSLSIFAAMTPETMLKYYDKKHLLDNGFLNRLLPYFMTTYVDIFSDNKNYKTDIIDEYNIKVLRLINERIANISDNLKKELLLSTAARRVFEEYKNKNGTIFHEIFYSGFAAKQFGRILRLAALLHIWRFGQPEEQEIRPDDMDTAISLCEALAEHAYHALDVEGRLLLANAKRVIKRIREGGHSVITPSTISNKLYDMPKNKLIPVLTFLAQHGYLCEVSPHEGRSEWIVSPHIWRA